MNLVSPVRRLRMRSINMPLIRERRRVASRREEEKLCPSALALSTARSSIWSALSGYSCASLRQLAELASYLRIVGLLGTFEVLERQFEVVD
jgi:hypothetical protein